MTHDKTTIAVKFMTALLQNAELESESFHAIAKDAIAAAEALIDELESNESVKEYVFDYSQEEFPSEIIVPINERLEAVFKLTKIVLEVAPPQENWCAIYTSKRISAVKVRGIALMGLDEILDEYTDELATEQFDVRQRSK